MDITIKLFATFREGRFNVETWNVRSPYTVGQLVAALQLPIEELGVLVVNGRHVELGQSLNDGDVCALFPRIGGG